MRVPDHVTWEAAAAIGGTSIAILGIAFHEHLFPGLNLLQPPIWKEPSPVLIYRGGTATGTMAMQLLKSVGLHRLAVCSRRSTPLAVEYGAEMTFDYESPTCATDIKSYTKRRLGHVLDIVVDQGP
ncbi:hypothetical protein F5Y16DRAFT_19975 [Xylariaceae sp. FL0255]|nr:hypothetical protein F5Y16DRAFT_19975 [Xylariaceae sp. FL0255]